MAVSRSRDFGADQAEGFENFRRVFLAGAAQEDIDCYDPESLAEAESRVLAAIGRHRPGQTVISIERDTPIRCGGQPVTAITIVQENMPFIFDSVLGEITELAGEPSFVVHPILPVRQTASGAPEILAPGAEADARLSVVHIHVPPLTEDRATGLEESLSALLKQVRAAVSDWKPMLARIDEAVTAWKKSPPPLDPDAIAEAIAFLEWLRADNFTFLGMREFHYVGDRESGRLKQSDRPSLGILSDPSVRILRQGDDALTTTPEIRAFLLGPEPLLVTKANTKSKVHRRAYMDYVGVKTFDATGALAGELRIVGLFTSTAYTRSVLKIPYLRSKARAVIDAMALDPADHLGKALINILESYPRDELFQISVPTLRENAEAILALNDRPRVRALVRADQFDRFMSVLVFVPRDRYDSNVRERIGEYLRLAFDGRVSAYYPAFPEGRLARVHFIIGRNRGPRPEISREEIETAIRSIIRTWEDDLAEAAAGKRVEPELADLAASFPPIYRERFAAAEALDDAERIRTVTAENPIRVDFLRRPEHDERSVALKILHHGKPVLLSQRVPLLENMGFRVVSEQTFEMPGAGDDVIFLHDMELETADGRPIDLSDNGELLEEVFLSVWHGTADNDRYNALAHAAGLTPDRISVLRAYGRYLQQAGIPQSQEAIAETLRKYPQIARQLFELFQALFDPQHRSDEEAERIDAAITEALEKVPALDDDSVIRRLRNCIEATLRTNFYAPSGDCSLAFKFDPHRLIGLPEPRAWREIFVYGPQVEGVHLRFGPVARGGLRWSDRAQDYRTEVLGLAKAQQVKNAVIVPVGAKGGFYPKRLPAGGDRGAVFEAGQAAYRNFIASLLSVTDNLEGDRLLPPPGVVRRDGDDPYLVVAADKGTATFSDIAIAIAREHGYWLDDAFASGGSTGYDHKKMGITARGAWEAVKRHFRELERDIQTEPFTVAGVGDMSGDVFGNGMLQSRCIRLIAAFDHRDIFIDPDPDPERSYEERLRLFRLGRSSWQDYDRARLSPGAMIVPRSQKSIRLTQEAARALDLEIGEYSPHAIIRAILKSRVDLLWFGGIGTYVRARHESDLEVGDHGNDPVRIEAREIRAIVVGEGANLGMTQRARIEYSLAGGRCNTDAIDNSGGVNSSDLEVNIKIALAAVVRSGQLSMEERNRLLADMTDEVAALVLRTNYRQTLAISLAERRAMADMGHYGRLMTSLEERGRLNRQVEYLPDNTQLAERQQRGEPLTRPEIAVLMAYAKLALFDDLIGSRLPDDEHLEDALSGYFPQAMASKYRAAINGHRLRREIIATVLANDVIDRGGPAFVSRLQDLTGRSAAEVAESYVLVRDGFELEELFAAIDALDNRVPGKAQLEFYGEIGRLIHVATAWFLRNPAPALPLGARIDALLRARRALEPRLADAVPEFLRATLAGRQERFASAGAPKDLAGRLAVLGIAELIPDIAAVAETAIADLVRASSAYFAVTERFRIARFAEAMRAVSVQDYYDGVALARANDMLALARRRIAVAALQSHPASPDPVADWLRSTGSEGERLAMRIGELADGNDMSLSRLTVAAGLLLDLASLSRG